MDWINTALIICAIAGALFFMWRFGILRKLDALIAWATAAIALVLWSRAAREDEERPQEQPPSDHEIESTTYSDSAHDQLEDEINETPTDLESDLKDLAERIRESRDRD